MGGPERAQQSPARASAGLGRAREGPFGPRKGPHSFRCVKQKENAALFRGRGLVVPVYVHASPHPDNLAMRFFRTGASQVHQLPSKHRG
jgi:hypothetical protein